MSSVELETRETAFEKEPAARDFGYNEEVPIPSSRRETVLLFIVVALTLAGHLPLLIEHFSDLMLRPHYQFVLFLPVGIGILTWQRWRTVSQAKLPRTAPQASRSFESFLSPPHLRHSLPLVIFALSVLAVAVWIWSPRVAMIAFMLSTFAFVYAIGGRTLLQVAMPGWLLTWLALPPPFNRDYWLIAKLRDVTTECASSVLDQVGLLHLVNGNVIEVPGHNLFVADACSGIHSLFVLMTFALFTGLYLRRNFLHIGLLLVSTFGIVLVENVMRIVGVAEGVTHGLEIATGWRHEAFGAILFVLSLILVFSTDQFFAFLLPENLLKWFRRKKNVTSPRIPATPLRIELRRTSSVFRLLPFAVAFAVLGIVQVGIMPANATHTSKLLSGYPFSFTGLEKAELPSMWKGWKLTSTTMESREKDDPLGQFSQAWRYEKGPIVADVSVDYPYQTPHNLATCYENIGWRMHLRKIMTTVGNPEVTTKPVHGAPYALALMEKPLYGHALLLYTSHDTQKGEGIAVCHEAQSFAELLRIRVSTPPCFQVQLMARSTGTIDDALQQELQQLFLQSRDILVPLCLSSLER